MKRMIWSFGERACGPQRSGTREKLRQFVWFWTRERCCGSQSRAPLPAGRPTSRELRQTGRWSQGAFTLIELLVVIAIIGILSALSLVAIAKIREQGRITEAKREINALKNAILEYHSDTGRYPVSDAVMTLAGKGDFTYGGTVNNSEVMSVLLNRERYMDGSPTINAGHLKNTKQKFYLSAVPMADAVNLPGLGPDLVFRDPWSNPYLISFDLNYDENCRDATYCKSKVSRDKGANGFNGLINSLDPAGATDDFQYRGGLMIWSLGPDGKADANSAANVSPNRDNILSWQ